MSTTSITPAGTATNSRESSDLSCRPNSGDHAGPAKKCLVMSIAIPVLAGGCILGAGLLVGPHILGKFSKVSTSTLSWIRHCGGNKSYVSKDSNGSGNRAPSPHPPPRPFSDCTAKSFDTTA
ncbi:hypothetical protein WJX79_000115 [Trebouxia sp. C0005]